MSIKKFVPASNRMPVRHTALAVAVAMGFGFSGQVLAQATTGAITGSAPIAAGESVRLTNVGTGLTRTVPVDATGHYYAASLPTGTYTVSLVSNGQVIASQSNVQVTVTGANVPFAAKELATVTVTANAIPPIDVTSTRQSSIVTAQQLKDLPIAHSAEAIALLAPGVTAGGNSLGSGPTGAPLVSMGGNTVIENAYYLNGFNTTDPIGGAGGVALPYFAIAEQQTITSGYGPEYGRSTGGVISQLGARGNNQWHFGAYASVRPTFAQSGFDNVYYGNPRTPVGALSQNPNVPPGTYLGTQGTTMYPAGYGNIEQGKKQNSDWSTVYDAYISGPLIKDKLFFFLTAEAEHDSSQFGLTNSGMVTSTGTQGNWQSTGHTAPKLYGKLDWNINDSNILELTGVKSQYQETTNNFYNYNYSNQTVGSYYGPGLESKNTFNIGILKYTSYITDNLTLEVLYGQMKGSYYVTLGSGTIPPYVTFAPGGVDPNVAGYSNINTAVALPQNVEPNPNHKSKVSNLRVDLDWKISDTHDLKFGIDNMQTRDDHDGFSNIGGATWNYFYGNPAANSPTIPYIGPTPTGYYVTQGLYGSDVSLAVRQKAQYVEDRWQVLPNLLLDLGIRNDSFENIAPNGEAYVRMTKPQWAPRLGFSWDIFGDSSAKLFGNAGRYYLALPTGLAARVPAMGTINGSVTYTYTGIGPYGVPTGLTAVPTVLSPGVTIPGFNSADGENGVVGNPKDYASTNLKAEYQDEFVLGFNKTLGGTGLVFGVQATYQRTGNFVDDTNLFLPDGNVVPGLVNPGKTNYIPYSQDPVGAPTGIITWNPNGPMKTYGYTIGDGVVAFPRPKRDYYSLDTSLEHTWDGKWYGRIDYVFSKSWGTTEGPTDTSTGQISNQSLAAGHGNGSGFSGTTTEQWDYPDIMQNVNGEQANSRRHTLKAFGAYSITPEWTVTATYIIQSGAPNVCLSGFGPQIATDLYDAGTGQTGNEHWCGGVPGGVSATGTGYGAVPSGPGQSGHTPWTHQLSLGLTYVPAWANKHLTFQALVHNVFNEQAALLYNSGYVYSQSGTLYYSPVYKTALYTEQPRYAEFNVKFDW